MERHIPRKEENKRIEQRKTKEGEEMNADRLAGKREGAPAPKQRTSVQQNRIGIMPASPVEFKRAAK